MENSYPDYPILSIFFSAITWTLAVINVTALDGNYLLPLAHVATICSGFIAVTLGLISIRDKFKNKNDKPESH